MIDGIYHINFKITGFDRDPLTSLIIECQKNLYVDKDEAHSIFNKSSKNYNRYAFSLLKDEHTKIKLNEFKISFPEF